jgi:YidC/Oxa1 family membrane protein insertase
MNEGRSQYIGIILICILVYIIAARFFKNREDNALSDAAKIEVIDSLKKVSNLPIDSVNFSEKATIILVSEEGDSVEVDALEYAAKNEFGAFYPFSMGVEKDIVLENELVKLTLSSKGAQVKQVELKDFKRFDQTPLMLVNETQVLNYNLELLNLSSIETQDLYFETKQEAGKVTFFAKVGSGQLAFEYSISPESYLVNYRLITENLGQVLNSKNEELAVSWDYISQKQEQDLSSEKTKSSAYWKVADGDVEHIGVGKSKKETLSEQVSWVSYKQRFFNTTLLSANGFKSGEITTDIESDDSTKVGGFQGALLIPLKGNLANQNIEMQLFYGPNNYKLLKEYDNGMHELIELSVDFFLFSWVKWINALLIIPLFNFIEKFIPNYGIIIFIMTLVIKMLLVPLTFKSYLSTAKTKVLKPELDALKEKFGDDSAGYSKAQMELYSKTGVSMFGGCLPMLLQMPFLLAMFYFFPSSIELRQESFLWAQDLSSFDTVSFLTWSKTIPLLGNHLSIFTLLMTASSLLMARFNPQMQSQPSQPGMEIMKYMPYIFPFFLLFLFNSFPAALTYYYFLSNMITFGQQWVINKFFIDEDKLKLQIEENKKKPVKKSKWASKMEEVYKQQELAQKQKKK